MRSSVRGRLTWGWKGMTTQVKPINGKVAKILNSREVALNVGIEQGVVSGMIFEILSGDGYEIVDPDTGDKLGSFTLPKTQVKVNRVDSKFSIAATFRSKRVDIGNARLFSAPVWETRYETLKANGSFESSYEDLQERDSYVSVGDPVVQVIEHR